MDKELIEDIDMELGNLERLVQEMEQIIDEAKGEPDFISIRAAGSIIHDFYSGVERIFERVAIRVDNMIPEGEDWHVKVLLQMGQAQRGRNVLIGPELL